MRAFSEWKAAGRSCKILNPTYLNYKVARKGFRRVFRKAKAIFEVEIDDKKKQFGIYLIAMNMCSV